MTTIKCQILKLIRYGEQVLKAVEQANNPYLGEVEGEKGKDRRKINHSGPGQEISEYS